MRFIPGDPDTSIEQTKIRLARYQEHQSTQGFSKWIILDRRSGCAIGDSGLLCLQENGWIDLGFRLARAHWGKGFATEAAAAWVRSAFEDFHVERLTSFVHTKNLASIRVLEKLGFLVCGQDMIMGMNSILFSLNARDTRAIQV